jgi:hypothetical protein
MSTVRKLIAAAVLPAFLAPRRRVRWAVQDPGARP